MLPHPKRRVVGAALLSLLLLCACSGDDVSTPSDDPDDYQVDTSVSYTPQLGQPRWIVPSELLPAGVAPLPSNNNLDILFHQGRLYLAWRTGKTHFAGPEVRMIIISSPDEGASWDLEHEIAVKADLREPRLLSHDGRLWLHFFQAGTNPFSFTPQGMWRTERLGLGEWTEREQFGGADEVPWCIKRRRGRVLMTSYRGENMVGDTGNMELKLSVSDDGVSWRPLDPARPVVYTGGVSETAFELDQQGDLWAVTRNENGDQSGFGSHVCHAPAGDLASWDCPAQSDPNKYDSPFMFRHAGEMYLVARRNVDGVFDQGLDQLSLAEQRQKYILDYWLTPKRTALYRVDREQRKVVHLLDLPSAGDTAFPSVRRTGEHSFLIANYTSPPDKPDISWQQGQIAPEGTSIYLIPLTFVPES